MNVAEMRMSRLMCGLARMSKIKKWEYIPASGGETN